MFHVGAADQTAERDRTQRLFVNNLAWSMTNAELIEIFRPFGEVFWARILERDDGKSKGCGFVQMRSGLDARRAIDGLNGAMIKGRKLMVSEAKS